MGRVFGYVGGGWRIIGYFLDILMGGELGDGD